MDPTDTPENDAAAAATPAQAPAVPAPAPAPAAPAAEAPAVQTGEAIEELNMIKGVVLDSAELATRSASLATNAGNDMRSATELMVKTYAKQRKQGMILLIASGVLMLITASVFTGMSVTLFSRLKMVDGMLLAVGKRVTELNSTMETVASVNEALQNLASQQEEGFKLQQKLEGRLDEVIKSTQGMPDAAAKQLEEKSQAVVKQVQAMDSRMQSQAAALQRISQQVQNLQGQVAESGQKLRSEVESMSRQQRERLQNEQAAAKAAAQKQKDRESALQYPRLPLPGASAPAATRP
jgi:myosin heavy subunit